MGRSCRTLARGPAASCLSLIAVAVPAVGCSYTTRGPCSRPRRSRPSRPRSTPSDGTLIHTFHAEENRRSVRLEEIPCTLRDAVIAIEDERFYRHNGVDVRAVARAVRENAEAGERGRGRLDDHPAVREEGAARGRLADRRAQAREASLALQLERHYSKDRILELYLNAIYFGNGAYGVAAAAQQYFAKPVASSRWPRARSSRASSSGRAPPTPTTTPALAARAAQRRARRMVREPLRGRGGRPGRKDRAGHPRRRRPFPPRSATRRPTSSRRSSSGSSTTRASAPPPRTAATCSSAAGCASRPRSTSRPSGPPRRLRRDPAGRGARSRRGPRGDRAEHRLRAGDGRRARLLRSGPSREAQPRHSGPAAGRVGVQAAGARRRARRGHEADDDLRRSGVHRHAREPVVEAVQLRRERPARGGQPRRGHGAFLQHAVRAADARRWPGGRDGRRRSSSGSAAPSTTTRRRCSARTR